MRRLIALAGCLTIAACDRGQEPKEPDTGPKTEQPASNERVFAEKDAGAIEVEVGSEFAVAVESNPALPLVWRVDGLAGDAAVVAGSVENVPAEKGECDGCGGFDHFGFKADHAGEAVFRLVQTHVGKPDDPPLRTVEVRVVVR